MAVSELSVHQILRDAVPEVADRLSVRARDVLVRMSACRTVALGRRRYDCDRCDEPVRVYNSCGERHCPQCSGRVRADWLERTALRLVPQTPYLQVVFTVPDQLSDLLLANRVLLYNVLITTAWKQLKALLESLGVQAAGLIVLHTWNQRLDHHGHLHVLIPCGGLSLDGSRWLEVDQRPELKAGNQWTLGKRFRAALIQKIEKLAVRGKLNLSGKLEFLQDSAVRRDWLASIAPHGFRVFVQPPPSDSTDPEIVLKYLAAYVSGGPIANGRLVARENGQVTFLARSRERPVPGRRREKVEVTIPETEFVRRWALHVLPKGFTRVRHYGRTGNRNCQDYLRRCREVRGLADPADDDSPQEETEVQPDDVFEEDGPAVPTYRCPKCGRPMKCVEFSFRPSWKDVMAKHRPDWYT